MKEMIARLRAAFFNLSDRERVLVSAAAGLLAVGLVYVALVLPALAAGRRVDNRLSMAEQQLAAMTRLRREYQEVSGRLGQIEQRIQGGERLNLRTTLESLAQQAGVRVDSMEPQSTPAHESYRETRVEIELKGVNLAQTVNYLHRIETAPQVLSVKTLRIRSRDGKGAGQLLDVTFTVSSFESL